MMGWSRGGGGVGQWPELAGTGGALRRKWRCGRSSVMLQRRSSARRLGSWMEVLVYSRWNDARGCYSGTWCSGAGDAEAMVGSAEARLHMCTQQREGKNHFASIETAQG
jgi:hypothetical protein